MPVQAIERKLAAIFAADVAGYSRLVGQDELGTLARLKAARTILDRLIAEHRGRIFTTAGDSVVADFASAVDAVQCAVAVQTALASESAAPAAGEKLSWRIGVHLGDVVIDGGNLLGDGVNIAARLEAMAEPGGICASAAVREQIGNKLPVVFADLGEQPVKNMPPIRAYRVQTGASPVLPAALPLPDKPSIGVLPFANMSGDPEQEYFVDGMVEEIITALSRIRWLFVIARNSSFTYKGQSVDVKQVGRELGVRYVLEGSVRKGGNRVRITGQLIDAETGTHLWADRFDGSLEDVFDLQDNVATSVAGVIEPALRAAETRRTAARPTADLTAYDLYLRALPIFYTLTKEGILQALDLFERAIARDPGYGPALVWAANCHLWRHLDGWAEEPETARRKGIDLARRALEVAGDDASVLANAALALAQFGEDIGTMITLVDRSLALDPSSARGWYASGLLRLWAGRPDLAIEHVETSLRLSPRERLGAHLSVIGSAYLINRQFDAAMAKLLVAIHDRPTNPPPYRALACCYAHLGRLDEAREIVERLRVLTPIIVPSVTPYRNAEHRELFLSGLRLAAGESE